MAFTFYREYKSLNVLRSGKVIDVDSIKVRMVEGEICEGDLYVGERNSGPKLLTCRSVNVMFGYVSPIENGYCFDIHECVRVEMIE